MVDNETVANRNAIINEPVSLLPSNFGNTGVVPGINQSIYRTPVGNVRPLAPPPLQSTSNAPHNGMSSYGFNNGYGFNNMYGNFGSAFSGFGNGFGMYGGAYNRFGGANGMSYTDPESRFIQLVEASSRPAFESIESLVMVINNIASMLDSTFFALTSSFRAILGVAANMGRLRSVFGQFWQTFAIFRSLNWIYKKLIYWLRISNVDPSSRSFKEAFAEAVNNTEAKLNNAPKLPRKRQSPWPVLAFVSFILAAPYLIMKLVGTVMTSVKEEALQPQKWINPIPSVALYDFQARNSSELTIRAGCNVIVAPREIQNTLGLLSTGFAMATTDGRQVGLIPINYVKSPQQMRQEEMSKPNQKDNESQSSQSGNDDKIDFDIAPQPMASSAPDNLG